MKMIDKRVALPMGLVMNIDEVRSVEIGREVGRGANCIVYDAVGTDSSAIRHKVRVKELYPVYLKVTRNEQFDLVCDEYQQDKFDDAKKLYLESYKKNVDFRNTIGIMNSTVNSSDILELNNTIYILMATDEGTDYGKYEDSALKELLEHMKAVACVLKRYHDRGYLHLDVKPENIFVIPETTEHIFLFDFDSVYRISELAGKTNMNLSFSEGFSAPEQLQGRIDRIGTHTDIYAIGAVLFYKLFHRKPEIEDCRISSTYSFAQMAYGDKVYQPKLFKELSIFFHKTLSTAVITRWNDMDKVISAMDSLIRLADIDETYLIDTFTYNSACFVGRSQELAAIHEALQENQVVFLSGIGGIGKTELAKRYAYQYRDEYDTIAFAFFEESIEHTICQEILVNKLSMEEEESEEEYFDRILEVLKRVTTGDDLIIIDNFDVEEDERLEELLQCPCRFLITTRKDYRDYNYKQININRLTDKRELKELFSTYNDEEYDEQENEWIDKLIDFVDGHTMTVELISKYLRNSQCMPSELFERFMEKSGVTNTEDYFVKQRKDRRMNSETVNNHLSILFDVFNFNECAKEIISSLSLFAGIRILKELFIARCNIENVSGELNVLIKNGWIEYNALTEKISLHQVIQDLIFSKLKPTSGNCPNIVKGMLAFVRDESGNDYERKIRKKVFNIFAERITGTDILYSKVCLEYGKVHKVEEAIALCVASAESCTNEVLTDLYMKKIEFLCQMDDMMISDDDMEVYGRKLLRKIAELFRLAVECCQKQELSSEILLSKYVELGGKMDEVLISNSVTLFFDDAEELGLIYHQIVQLYEFVTQKLPEVNVDTNEKEKLYTIMQKFYSDEDELLAEYKTKHFGSMDKAYQYQVILDNLRENSGVGNPDILIQSEEGIKRWWSHDVTKKAMADKYADEGNYDLAIEFYKKAYEEEDEVYDQIFQSIAHIYLKKGDVDKAIDCLKRILDYDKKRIADEEEYGWYSCYICIELIQILMEHAMYEEAVEYANELIAYMQEKINEEDNEYSLSHVIMAYYYLYQMEQQEAEKSRLWKKCVELFSRLRSNELQEVLYPFLEEYLCKEQPKYREILWLLDSMDRYDQYPAYKEKLVRLLIQKNECVMDSIPNQVELLLKLVETKVWGMESSLPAADKLCKEAEDLLEKHQIEDVYLCNKSLQIKTEIMSRKMEEFERIQEIQKTINYYAIAEREAEYCDGKEQMIELWKKAAESYGVAERYEEKEICLKKTYEILFSLRDFIGQDEYDQSMWDILRDLAWTDIQLKNYEQAGIILKDLFQNQVEQFVCCMEKEEKELYTKKEERALYLERIKNIAWFFELAKMNENRFLCYLAALYMLIAPMPEADILRGLLSERADVDIVCEKIMSSLSDVNPELVAEVIGLKVELSKCDGIEEVYREKISPVLEFVSKQYENTEVEFKY